MAKFAQETVDRSSVRPVTGHCPVVKLEMAGKTVKNLESYMALMAGYKKGDVLDIAILRDGKKVSVKVTLE